MERRKSRRRRDDASQVRFVTALVVGMMALAPAITHAAAWLKPVVLNLSNGFGPSVAADAQEDTDVVWGNQAGVNPGVVRGAHDVFGSGGFPQLPDFSTDAMTGHVDTSPVVVTNRSGNGLVLWVNDLSMGNAQIQLRTISPNGTVVMVQSVGAPTGSYADPVAAINDNGDAIVAWKHVATIEAIARKGLKGSFTNVAIPDQLDMSANASPAAAIVGAGMR